MTLRFVDLTEVYWTEEKGQPICAFLDTHDDRFIESYSGEHTFSDMEHIKCAAYRDTSRLVSLLPKGFFENLDENERPMTIQNVLINAIAAEINSTIQAEVSPLGVENCLTTKAEILAEINNPTNRGPFWWYFHLGVLPKAYWPQLSTEARLIAMLWAASDASSTPEIQNLIYAIGDETRPCFECGISYGTGLSSVVEILTEIANPIDRGPFWWFHYLPKDLKDCWPHLSTEARLVAMLCTANQAEADSRTS